MIRQRDERGQMIQERDEQYVEVARQVEAIRVESEQLRVAWKVADARSERLQKLLAESETAQANARIIAQEEIDQRAALEDELLATGVELEAVLQQILDLETRTHNFSHALIASEAEVKHLEDQLQAERGKFRTELAERERQRVEGDAEQARALERVKADLIESERLRANAEQEQVLAQFAAELAESERLQAETANAQALAAVQGQLDQANALVGRLTQDKAEFRQVLDRRDSELIALQRVEYANDGRLADHEADSLEQRRRADRLEATAAEHAELLAEARAILAATQRELETSNATRLAAENALSIAQNDRSSPAAKTPGGSRRRTRTAGEILEARFLEKDVALRKVFDGLLSSMKPDVICDVGAMNGDESVRFRKVCPEAKVYLFEASKRNFEGFILPRKDLTGVKLENLAISDIDGVTTFHELIVADDSELWKRGAGSLRERLDQHATAPIEVKTTRLDTYFAKQIEDRNRFVLWVDVEGALDQVLAGGQAVLDNTLALRVEVEHKQFWENEKLAPEIVSYMNERGFSVFGNTYTPGALAQSDLLLINNNWLDMTPVNNG